MTEPRTLIPTPRQIELGDEPPAGLLDRGRQPLDRLDVAPGEHGDGRSPEDGREPRQGMWRRTLRDADPRRITGPKTPLVVFGLVALLAQWDDAALGALLPEIRADLGLSTQVLAAIASAVSLTVLALGVPFGYLADRIKRTTMLRVGIIGTNAASIVQAVAPGLGQLVAGRLIAGAGVGAQQPASFSYMADTFPSESRTRVFAFTYLVAQVGAILGPIIAGVLGQLFGWRVALASLGILATVVGLLTFLLREPVRGRLDRLEAGADESTADHEQAPLSLGESLRAAWSIRTVRRIVIATPFLYLKGGASLTLLAFYFSEVFVLSPSQRGVIGAAYALLGVIGLIAAAPLGDRLLATRAGSFLPLMAAGLLLQAAAFVVLGFTGNVGVAIVVAAPLSALDVILAPAFFALLSQVIPARIRGLGLQVQTPAQLIGILLFPVMVGFIDNIGLHRGIALFAIPTLLAALALASGGPGTERDRRTAMASGLAEEFARRAAEEGRSSVLVCREVEAGYGAVPVLTGIDLDVSAGEVLAVLGPNGAGKSTLLRAIAGVRPASAGAIAIAGRDTTTTPSHVLARRGVMLVPGGQAVIAGVTVDEHLRAAAAIGARPAGSETAGQPAPGRDPGAAVEAALAELPALAGRRDQVASTLSGGEQQLLALACARLADPVLLLVDELSLGLAPAAVRDALRAARRAAEGGAAVVVVEQSVQAALEVADRVMVIEKGEIVFAGTPDELRARPGTLAAVALGGERRRSRPRRGLVSPATTGTGADDTSAIRCQGVSLAFGGVQALHGVDISVQPGEILGLIGPNGAGKTTLFDVLSGFVEPDAGRVLLAGVDVSGHKPADRARAGLGRSFQRARLFPGLTVRDAVLVALDRRASPGASLAPLGLPGARKAEARLRRRAEGTLELLGLDRWAGVPVAELPTGTRRLVALACTLAFEPSVLLLDEPTAGLSRLEAEEVPPLLRRTARETGAALLVVEHDVPLLAAAADRFVAMVGGVVVADGLPDDVIEDPVVLASYLGTPDLPENVANRGDLTHTPPRHRTGQED